MREAFDYNLYLKGDASRDALLRDKVFDYDYGDMGDGMRPGQAKHDKLVQYGIDIAVRGFTPMMPYHELWRKTDWKVNGYVTPEQADPRGLGIDKKRNIIVPMSFRMEEMYCAAAHGIFDQDPMFKWRPYPSFDSLINAATAEYMVQRHVHWGRASLHNDSVTRAAFRYGIGMAGLKWTVKRAQKPVDRPVTREALSMLAKRTGVNLPKHMIGRLMRDMEQTVVREYTEIQPWDPYSSFYDPTITPNDFERAAFRGTCYPTDANQVLLHERENPGTWFNGWYFKMLAEGNYAWSQFNKRNTSGRDTRQGTTHDARFGSGMPGTKFMAPGDVLYIECLIVPSEWELGEETYPCNWFLAIGGDKILLGCGPLDRAHGEGDTLIMAPNADGHTFIPISHVLTTLGIHEHVDEIMQCTSVAVRQNVNGGWTIFNDNILNWDDYVDGDNVGQVIRPIRPALTKEMMEAALIQIPHLDNTPQHMAYMDKLMQIATDGNGTSDIGGPGNLVDAERTTKFLAQAQINSSSSRFKRLAGKMGQQYYAPLGWKMLYNLVQFGKQQQMVDLAGRFADRIRQQAGAPATGLSFMADPRDLEVMFEMEPYSGDMPEQKDMSSITQIMMAAMGIPEIAAEMFDGFPARAVLDVIAREAGLENLDDFPPEGNPQQGQVQPATMQPMPDQMVQQQAQAGNIVPIGPMRGAMA